MMPDSPVSIIIFICSLITSLWATGHALLHKRDPRAALLWVCFSLLFPFVGPLAYWLLGINRISRRAIKWQKAGRKPGFQTLYPMQGSCSQLLPDQFDPLKNLECLTERVVQTRNHPGNLITPLFNGEEAYPSMLGAIDAAAHSIHLSSYIFDGDHIGSRFTESLKKAAARGVTVRVIVDALGERYSKVTARESLRGSLVDLRHYLPLYKGPFINLRNHRKLLIVDGRLAFTGGMNIRNNHCISKVEPGKGASDVHFRVAGPAVADLQRVFLEDWYFVAGEKFKEAAYFPPLPPVGDSYSRVIADGPDRAFRRLEWVVMGAISSARSRVWIMTPYFIPDRPMMTALVLAALRGVDVTLVLPTVNNLPFVAWASRASYWELIKNGVKLMEQPAPFAHTKLLLVDDAWSLLGSANLDTRSFRLNFELNLAVYDHKFVSSLTAHFNEVMSKSRMVTLEEMDNRKLLVKLRDATARLFTPYL